MKRLTTSEEEIMLIIWQLNECTVRDIIKELKDQDVPYTTVSTVVRILEKKEFVTHRVIGNTHLYSPVVAQENYAKQSLSRFLNKYFKGSFTNMASFFASENDLSISDLKEMIQEIESELEENSTQKNNDD